MYVVVHYSEIGIKGKNRAFFERKLIENIRKTLGKGVKKVYRRYGRIVCDLDSSANFKKIKGSLEKLPGVAYFSFAVKSELELTEIKKMALDVLKDRKFSTFKVISRISETMKEVLECCFERLANEISNL